ncbi:hypothetical protein CXB51_021413 [Gossypium anomalum]|uniref:Uncharacterized protein n=1 Tax=Gossypium anomalum TaxID=47600 RepID=A0A8J6CRQ7_9ROSI|nr:hypothetical protein CXB51_021413 [Gossypium anomalum]
MSDIANDSEISFEQDLCIEDTEDFEDDQNCGLSPDLLRMVEQGEKKILPHKESVEIVNLGEGKEVKIRASIAVETKQDLIELLQEFKDVFAWLYQDMPGLNTDIMVHRLPIKEECKPVQQKLRMMRPDILLKIKEEVKKQFDAGFLQVVKYSKWVANIVPVPKKDGKVRMCVDYRDLNKASPKDNFPLPHIDTLVDNTAGSSLFSFMDGFSGYNQIKMHPEDMEKTTFVTMWGTFCYKVMPFGLKNTGATYQRAMVTLFHDMMYKEIEVYVDDMIAKSRTENEHVQVLRKLFLRLRKFQLKLNLAKCTFGVRSGKLLGFVVSEKGIEIDPDKIRAIQELPPPRIQKEHNPGVWDEECQKTFDKVKHSLSNALVLMPPCPDKPLILYLAVLENSMGCVLGQHDETGRKEKVIYYLSKKFTECETRYSPIEKLCCALIWTTRRLRQYMLYHTNRLISKLDPLKYMMESNALNKRMARWQISLFEFDIVYVNQKAVKGSAIADFLASRALEDYEPLSFDFPNEDLMYVATIEEDSQEAHPWKLNFDGASNAVGNGIGAVLVSPNGDHYPFTSKLDFDCTNNMAEYEACIMGIRAAIECKIKVLEVYGDSALVIYQLKGEWETRYPKLISYRRLVLELIEEFDDITFCYLPRDENQMADALATLASMIKVNKQEDMNPIQMSIYEAPAHCYNIEEEEEKDDHPWYQDILRYVKSREYPDQATENDKRTLRRLASDYVLDGEILYKIRKDQVLLRCVDAVEAKQILEEVHEGVCGTHANGPISPKASNGHRFIFVVIDYFTKWVEATSYANITKSAVSKFLKKEIICRYGIPE